MVVRGTREPTSMRSRAMYKANAGRASEDLNASGADASWRAFYGMNRVVSMYATAKNFSIGKVQQIAHGQLLICFAFPMYGPLGS